MPSFKIAVGAFFTLMLFAGGTTLFAQHVPREFFDLDRFLATGDWDSELGTKISYRIIANGKTELKNLQRMAPANETIEDLGIKKDALKLALDPYDSNKHHFTDESNNKRKREEVAARAKQVLGLVGAEQLVKLQLERSAKKLKATLEDNQNCAYTTLSYFDNDYVAGLLQLSESQKEQYQKFFDEAKSKIRKGNLQAFEKLVDDHNEQFVRVLKVLDPAQSKTSRELICEPVHWFRDARERSLVSIDASHLMYTVTVGDYKSLIKDRAGISEVKPHEFTDQGIEYMYGHVHALLHDPFAWDELEFTDEQRKARKRQLSVMSTSGFHDLRLQEFLEGNVAYPEIMSDFLVPTQMELFRNLEFQYLTSKYRSSFGLLHPSVATRLKITNDQQRQIEKISADFQKCCEIAEEAICVARKSIVAEFHNQVEGVLTEDQNRILSQLMGNLIEEK